MRSLMLRSLTIASLLSTSIFASNYDNKILKYEKRRVSHALARVQGKLEAINLALKKDIKQDGWIGYVFTLDMKIKGKTISQKDFLFAKGNLAAPDLFDIRTKKSFKDTLFPKLGKEFYNKKYLIAGESDAKHTLILFSDPLCPICLDEVPDLIEIVKAHPNTFALYYYPMPLNMHPTAKTFVKAAMILHSKGINDVDYKLYKHNAINFNSAMPIYDQYKEKDNEKALEVFNKIFHSKITMAEINEPKWEKELTYLSNMSEKAFVRGTPTLYFDGEIDKSREKYTKYLK